MSNNISRFPGSYNGGHHSKGDGGGGMGGDIERRVGSLEGDMKEVRRDIAALRTDMEVVKIKLDNCATKADLSDLKSSLIQWMVGTIIAAVGVASALVFNIAKSPQAAPTQPTYADQPPTHRSKSEQIFGEDEIFKDLPPAEPLHK